MAASSPKWLDVTPFVSEVCRDLRLGELLHGENFSLFDAMSAIEIGDPKMDQGLAGSSGSLDELLEACAPTTLTGEKLLAVLYRLLAAEASWHNGGTIVQTLFTCLYLHKPDRVADKQLVLSSYCVATLACAALVRDLVIHGMACEDEDFLAHTFGLRLESSLTRDTQGVVKALGRAVELLEAIRQRSSVGSALGSALRLEGRQLRALLALCKSRRALLQALYRISTFRNKSDLDAARKLLLTAASELREAAAEPPGEELLEQAPGFLPDINARLHIPVPPRPLKMYTLAEALKYWEATLEDLTFACAVTRMTSYPQLRAFMTSFARRECGALPRSCLHYIINRAHKLGKFSPPPWTPSESIICAATQLPAFNTLKPPEVVDFVKQCVIGVEIWVHVMCLTPARRQRRLRRLLEDWYNLYSHAINADLSPEVRGLLEEAGWRWQEVTREAADDVQGPLGSWVERECCATMLAHLLLGFQLDLYAPREFPMIYWYCDYLFGISLQDCKQLQLAAPSWAPPPPAATLSKKDKGGKRDKGAVKRPQPEASAALYAFEVGVLEAQRQLCQALMRLVLALKLEGLVADPPTPFNGPEQRFEQRFAHFQVLQSPEPLSASHYTQSIDTSGVTSQQLYGLAAECFTRCRGALTAALAGVAPSDELPQDELTYFKRMERVAATNSVALAVLRSSLEAAAGGQEDRQMKLSWDFSVHPHYPVMGIKHAAKK